MASDCAGVRMMRVDSSAEWTRLQGQTADGFLLRQLLGASDGSAVFLTSRGPNQDQRAAIKLLPAEAEEAALHLARWRRAAALSHPRLLRLFEMGPCRLQGREFAYLVMEYAAETLADILPQRPLTPDEAREMLPPILEAFGFLHGRGLAHNRLRPSNILVVEDQIKLSSDSITAVARGKTLAPPAGSADIRSLGVMLFESLTQRAPAADPSLPETLPPLFHEIVRGCLLPDPHHRWSVEEIARQLRISGGSEKEEKKVRPAAAARPRPWRRYLAPLALTAVLLAAGIYVPRLLREPQAQPGGTAPESQPPAQVQDTPGRVLHPVMPDVPPRAQATIRGTVRVRVRVQVDPDGQVSQAELDRSGPSRYFARLALAAARQWKFQPPQREGRGADGEWLLSFAFTREGTRAAAERVAR